MIFTESQYTVGPHLDHDNSVSGFTTCTASRYLYLPTMGFGWVAAGLLLALHVVLLAVIVGSVAGGMLIFLRRKG